MTSKTFRISSVLTAIAVVGSTLFAPVAAQAGQSSKNDMRNLAIGSAIIAGIGLLNHNQTMTTIGAAGAVIGASAYEQDRQRQSAQNNDWRGDRGYGTWDRNDNRGRDNGNWDRNDNRDNGNWDRH